MQNANSTAEQSRHFNERIILNVIRRQPGIARADIASVTGLSAQSVSVITQSLLERGLIQSRGRTKGRRGQPRIELVLNPEGVYSIGINIDRDHIGLAVLDFEGTCVFAIGEDCIFPGEAEAKGVVVTLMAKAKAFLDEDCSKIAGVGFSRPDYMDQWLETMLPTPMTKSEIDVIAQRLAYWQLSDFEVWIAEHTQLPCSRENDAVVSAMGEMLLAHPGSHFVYLFVSVACGSAIVNDDEIVRGSDGRAGRFGLIPLMDNPFGRCMVEVLSLSGLRRYLERHGQSLPENWLQAPNDEIQALAKVWADEIAPLIAPTLSVVVAMENPQRLLFGGHLPDWLAGCLMPSLQQSTVAISLLPVPPFELAQTAQNSGAIGAALLPLYETFSPNKSILVRQS